MNPYTEVTSALEPNAIIQGAKNHACRSLDKGLRIEKIQKFLESDTRGIKRCHTKPKHKVSTLPAYYY